MYNSQLYLYIWTMKFLIPKLKYINIESKLCISYINAIELIILFLITDKTLEKNKVRGITNLLHFKTHFIYIYEISIYNYWNHVVLMRHRYREQWYRIHKPQIDPHVVSHLAQNYFKMYTLMKNLNL